MNAKPKFTLSKFTGMSDNGGAYYLDGFSVVKEGQYTSLDENFTTLEMFNTGTTGFSTLTNVSSMLSMIKLTGSTLTQSNFVLSYDSAGFFLKYQYATGYEGYVGGIAASGNYLFCQKPDMISLPSNNFIWTSAKHLGLAIRGKVKTGSSTTTIIDADGRNFTTLGLTTTAPNNTVCNITTGKLYTITSIGNGSATNDKLTFTAIGTSPNTENDEFIAFISTRWDLDAGITVPTFSNQQIQVYMARPIRQFGVGDSVKYMILNGNYISLLSNDESTLYNAFKQLPTGYQGLAMDVNSGFVLVSAYDNNGRGHLLYWDGFSSGWNNDMSVDKAPRCVKNYDNGWVYFTNGELYFTDGSNKTKLIGHPDTTYLDSNMECPTPNSIACLNGKIYIVINGTDNNRVYNSILVFDKVSGLYSFKTKVLTHGFASPWCIYNITYTDTQSIYSSSNTILVGLTGGVNSLRDYNTGKQLTNEFGSAVFLLDFQQETQIKEVWLNLKNTSKSYSTKDSTTDITVNYGNGNKGIISYGSVGSIPATTTMNNTNGVAYPGQIGDEIEILSGGVRGERTFITGISGTGASEVWTVSPALSGTSVAINSDLRIWRLKKGEQKTISVNNLSIPQRFEVNFIGSKMYLEIVVKGGSNSMPVSIMDIQIF